MKFLRVAFCSMALLGLSTEFAYASPSFARKYETSCQTCHIAYPKLNAYGEAFRTLGYRLPGELEDQVKDPDIKLGSDAYKRVWPKAVWPGGIPGSLPVAIVADFRLDNLSSVDENGERQRTENDFVFPAAVEMVLAGTAGDNMAFFGEIAFEQEVDHGERTSSVAVEHFDVRFVGLAGDSAALNLKVGAFQPEIVSNFDHARRLTLANYDSMFGVNPFELGGGRSVGGGGHDGGGSVSLPAIGLGVEAWGVLKQRLIWSLGVVNGRGPGEDTFDANSGKDVFARLAYKFGGLAPDGSNAATFETDSKNWRERSFRIGAFAYQGDRGDILQTLSAVPVEEEPHDDDEELHAALSALSNRSTNRFDPEVEHAEEESHSAAFLGGDEFTRFGIEFNWIWDDLNVFGAFVQGEDDLLAFASGEAGEIGELIADQSGTFDYEAWFLEADLVLGFPWLHGALRYENVDLPGRDEHGNKLNWRQGVVSVTGLIRANTKLTLEHRWDLERSQNYSTWMNLGLAF